MVYSSIIVFVFFLLVVALLLTVVAGGKGAIVCGVRVAAKGSLIARQSDLVMLRMPHEHFRWEGEERGTTTAVVMRVLQGMRERKDLCIGRERTGVTPGRYGERSKAVMIVGIVVVLVLGVDGWRFTG